jgi:hypothetical protein
LLLQKRVTLPHFSSAVWHHRWRLLATEDDLLKEEDMILPINVGLGDDEYIIKEEFAEIFEVVPLPVIDARLQVLYR